MRALLVLSLMMSAAACSNAIEETLSENPRGTVTGVAYDGIIVNGKVTIYAFDGNQGATLAEGMTNAAGAYSIDLRVASQPVMIEITGGSYQEEASGHVVPLQEGQRLLALALYTPDIPLTVHATYWTTLAAGLAQYKVKTGATATQAIEDANKEISDLLGLPILTTVPLEPTVPLNRRDNLTPELEYGYFAAAVSKWTALASDFNKRPVHTIYSSIAFSQLAFEDIRYDGVLNGKSEVGALSVGGIELSTDIYRHAIALAILSMANDKRNIVGVTPATLLVSARRLNDATIPIFRGGTVIPLDEGGPMIARIAPDSETVFGVFTGIAEIADVVGVAAVEFLVDGVSTATAADPARPSVSIDSSGLSEGHHTLTVRVTNLAGNSTSADRAFDVSNKATLISNVQPADGSLVRGKVTASATVYDSAGIDEVVFTVDEQDVGRAHGLGEVKITFDSKGVADGDHKLRVTTRNSVGYTLSVENIFTADNTLPVIEALAPAADADYAGPLTATAQVSDAHLSAVEFFLDSMSQGLAADFSPSAVTIDSRQYIDGPHTLGVRGEDAAGNQTIATWQVNFDNSPPRVSEILPVPGSWLGGPNLSNISFLLSDRALNAVTLTADGVAVATTVNGAGPWRVSAGYAVFASGDGEHNLVITASDVAGNVAREKVSIFVDATRPISTASVSRTLGVPACSGCLAPVLSCTVNGLSTDAGIGLKGVYIEGSLVSTASTVAWSFTSNQPVPPAGTVFPKCSTYSGLGAVGQIAVDKLDNSTSYLLYWCNDPVEGITCVLRML